MDYSRPALQNVNICPTPAPAVANVYPYENPFRLPSIPENREVTVHPTVGDCRAAPPAYGQTYDYDMQTVQPVQNQAMYNHQPQAAYQVQQPIQTTQTTPYAGVVPIPMEFNLHSSIPGEVIWFNLSLAKVSVTQFLF